MWVLVMLWNSNYFKQDSKIQGSFASIFCIYVATVIAGTVEMLGKSKKILSPLWQEIKLHS